MAKIHNRYAAAPSTSTARRGLGLTNNIDGDPSDGPPKDSITITSGGGRQVDVVNLAFDVGKRLMSEGVAVGGRVVAKAISNRIERTN